MKKLVILIRKFLKSRLLPDDAVETPSESETLPKRHLKRVYLAQKAPKTEGHIRIDVIYSSSTHLLAYASNIWIPNALQTINERLATITGEMISATDGWQENWRFHFLLESNFDRRTESCDVIRPENSLTFSWKTDVGFLNFKELELNDDLGRKKASVIEAVVLTLLNEGIGREPFSVYISDLLPALCSSIGEFSDDE